MKLGNIPKTREAAVEGKVYWSLAIGRDAIMSRYFEGGWRAFEFVIYKPFHMERYKEVSLPWRFRIAFAYWLPFYAL